MREIVCGRGLRRLWVITAGLALVFGALSSARAAEKLWGCLLYASSEKTSPDVPKWLKNYNERLTKIIGYTGVRSLGQTEISVQTDKPAIINLRGNMRIQLNSCVREGNGRFLVNLRLFQGERQLIETQARVSKDSPLFFRGPLWRNGQLIVAVVIGA